MKYKRKYIYMNKYMPDHIVHYITEHAISLRKPIGTTDDAVRGWSITTRGIGAGMCGNVIQESVHRSKF